MQQFFSDKTPTQQPKPSYSSAFLGRVAKQSRSTGEIFNVAEKKLNTTTLFQIETTTRTHFSSCLCMFYGLP